MLTKDEVEKFKVAMDQISKTTYGEAFKDTAFVHFLYVNGVEKFSGFQKAMEDFAKFHIYLNSANIGVVSEDLPDDLAYGFAFIDEAEEAVATIHKA